MTPNFSFACFPGRTHTQSASLAKEMADAGALTEPALGDVSLAHVQLVPQNHGLLNEETCDALRSLLPGTRFRLHANVRVLPKHRFAELSGFQAHHDWFERAAAVSRHLGADAYSAHSGSRSECSMQDMFENARRAADLFGCPVAIEGQYGTSDNKWLVSTWSEYQEVMESGVPYALDLSHLKILAAQTGQRNETLIAEMLACERCIEVHVSDNDGSGDWHQKCVEAPWWFPLTRHINPNAVVFTEGNFLKERK